MRLLLTNCLSSSLNNRILRLQLEEAAFRAFNNTRLHNSASPLHADFIRGLQAPAIAFIHPQNETIHGFRQDSLLAR
jgi:hypothetical protein